jgi:hypothetical protein
LIGINAVRYVQHIAITVGIACEVHEPFRNGDFLGGQAPGRLGAIAGNTIEEPLIVLNEMGLGSLGRREARDPLGGFPPGGDGDIAIGYITIAHGAIGIDLDVREIESVKMGRFTHHFGPAFAVPNTPELFAERERRTNGPDAGYFVTAFLEVFGMNSDNAPATG